jgi:hypothetical protein
MVIIQTHFGYWKALGKHGRFVGPLLDLICHNPNLGFMTIARACKVVGQKGSLGVKESVRE